MDWSPPLAMITDRDPKFLSEFCTSACQKLGIKTLTSTAYHSQTDGQSERNNQTAAGVAVVVPAPSASAHDCAHQHHQRRSRVVTGALEGGAAAARLVARGLSVVDAGGGEVRLHDSDGDCAEDDGGRGCGRVIGRTRFEYGGCWRR